MNVRGKQKCHRLEVQGETLGVAYKKRGIGCFFASSVVNYTNKENESGSSEYTGLPEKRMDTCRKQRRKTVETAIEEKQDHKENPSAVTAGIASVAVKGGSGYLFLKRVVDIVAALTIGALLLVPMDVIGILIKLDSPGPALYRQERLGKCGKPFMLYKFRSMKEDAEADGPQWAKINDDRCTKIGHMLRQTRLDELPQLINILKGEMSFVGPRPERAYFYEQFEKYIPGFSKRLAVTPGLTGWAQVNGGYNLAPEEKIIYDMEYISNRSFQMELQCILRTFGVVFFQKGAR